MFKSVSGASRITKSLQAGAAALALAGFSLALPTAMPAVAAAQTPTPPQITPELRKMFRDAMIESGGEFMKELIEQFPAEYYAFETEMLEGFLAGTLTPERAQQRGFEFSSGLVPRMYEGVNMAPDDEVLALARLQLKTAREFSVDSPKLCYQFLEGSTEANSTSDLSPEGLKSLNAANLAMMRLAKSGRAAKIKRAAPSPAEIAQIRTAFKARGGDERWLAGVGGGSFGGMTDKARCATAIVWMETLLAQEKSLAVRTLAYN